MLTKLIQHKLFLPSLMSLLFLLCLIRLGLWQLERRLWKEDLLHQISTRTQKDPIDLDLFLNQMNLESGNSSAIDFEYFAVKARGHFLLDKEIYFYAPDQNFGAGYHLYTPFLVKNSHKILFVNRGFVPEQKKDPKTRTQALSQNEIEIAGLIRMPGKQSFFVPDNELNKNLWFWRDLEGMMRASFNEKIPPYYPFFVETLKKENEGPPIGGVTLLQLPNRHLEYALTWFGLAFALFIIYSLYVVSYFRHKSVKP